MSEQRKRNEDVVEIDLNYIETPRGRVAAFETVKQLANAIVLLNEEEENIRNELRRIARGPVDEQRVKSIEERLDRIEQRLDDMMTTQDYILDTLQELNNAIAGLKKK